MFREAEKILAELGMTLDVRKPARGLTLAAQQSVGRIAKAISLNVRVLIMDEPTASLSAHEAQELFKLVRDLKRQGVAILFVSHRMEEVFEIADKITVFRDGRLISTRTRLEATPQRAIADMVGREIDLTKARTTCTERMSFFQWRIWDARAYSKALTSISTAARCLASRALSAQVEPMLGSPFSASNLQLLEGSSSAESRSPSARRETA